MGNICSSSQKKDREDSISEKSDDSPPYHIGEKQQEPREPPIAQPESDLNGFAKPSDCPNRLNSTNLSGDSLSSPICATPPVEISTLLNLPQNLTSLYGRPSLSRRIEKDRKVVLYVLAADDSYQIEKAILTKIRTSLQARYNCKGFEVHVADLHVKENHSKSNRFDLENWLDGPLEAQCGHHLAANCLAEITRHSTDSYVIPILFLNSSLGDPLLPLTIESQDFANAKASADNCGKQLLEKWYELDETSQPSCYRLKSIKVEKESVPSVDEELNSLLVNLVEVFAKELRDSYLTTVVEQEINNTVLMSQELSKRCIWIQHSGSTSKHEESSLENEVNRRLANIQNELRNQLAEKHIIKMPVASQQQQDQFLATLESAIASEVDLIVEEHTSKFQVPFCTFGVDRRLLNEIEEVNRHSQILNQNSANFSIIEQVKDYLTGDSAEPLVIYGSRGCGKSVLAAKIAANVHQWIPECSLVLRFVGLTALSSDLTSILSTIIEQISVLLKLPTNKKEHTTASYTSELQHLIEKSSHQVVILVDSIDKAFDITNIDWLPLVLANNVKIVLTVTEEADEAASQVFKALKSNIKPENFLQLPAFTQEQWEDVLTYGGGAGNGALQLPEDWKKSDERAPIQAKILWWLAWFGERKLENLGISHTAEKLFDILEAKFGAASVKYLITLINASREGLLETEIIELLENSKIVQGSVAKFWTNFCWVMGPLLLHNKTIKLMDSVIHSVAAKRYESDMETAHKVLLEYFEKQPDSFSDKKNKEICFNTRKIIELPFHSYKTDKKEFETSKFLCNLTWLHDKIKSTGCVQFLLDIYLTHPPPTQSQSPSSTNNNSKQLSGHLEFLLTFIQTRYEALNYDAQQIYSLLSTYIKREEAGDIVKGWLKEIEEKNILTIEKIEFENDETAASSGNEEDSDGYDQLINTNNKTDENFIISVHTAREEICVWDVVKGKKVRTLKGIPQPSSVCPVGEFKLAVLCKREIRVLDLNEGAFKVTLKGVMNQKMPYFGQHDAEHLVCLSRNRMYVNLMNLESGGCVTTFKAGEDRFLNSLLVSGDGRILVCGDETQKPFPLLVWHLTQRKLLYDLRIPHHDFITSLSAITHEGSYVCVVAKELQDPSPNFIIVYDLQSGTLFKKWKPSCNTVSLAISQTNTCVIAGLEDARILIWDLVTGNCRCSLTGHNAPVTLLKLDPLGKVLLSGDIEGRDKSIRLWDLSTGTSLAVYTPSIQITACEMNAHGKLVVIALKNIRQLVTLELKGGEYSRTALSSEATYGNSENEGKEFELKE